MTDRHTPTPWRAVSCQDAKFPNGIVRLFQNYIRTIRYGPIAVLRVDLRSLSKQQANATFICRACNMFDELVAALEEMDQQAMPSLASRDRARAIIAKAKGKPQ